MPGGSWRWGTVAAGVVWACSAGTIHAQAQSLPGSPLGPSAPLAPTAPTTGVVPAAAGARAPTWPAGSATLSTPPGVTTIGGLAPPASLPPTTPTHGTGEAEYHVKDITPHKDPRLESHDEHHAHPEGAGNLGPIVPDDRGLFVSAEALIMRPRRGGLDYGIVNPGGLAVVGPVQGLNYDLTAGIRGELGYQFGHCGWDVVFGYTYYRTAAEGFLSAPPGGAILPTLTRPGLITQATSSQAQANINYNLYDMFVGKRFVVDDNFAVRTFGGFRFADITQEFNATYDGLDARGAGVGLRSRFQGFGPVAGAEAVLAAQYGFHLYARASGGLLTGLAKNPYFEANDLGKTVYADVGYDVRKVVPLLSVGIGGGWQYKSVWLRGGYEITNYFGLIDQPRFTDDVTPGKFVTQTSNLSLEGLFFQVGMNF